MMNILKMDLKRILYSKSFYVSLIIISVMAFAAVYSQMTTSLEGALGIASGINSGDDFMIAMMGTGLLNILLSIIISIFICGDYSSGMAKNIFSVHSNKWEYISSKIVSMSLVSALFILVYIIESIIALLFFTTGFSLTGGILGVVAFFIEKWLSSCAFISIITLICCYTRHSAWGILAGFLVATGGLTMGVLVIANLLPIPMSIITAMISFTVSGSTKLATLDFSIFIFIKIALVSFVWFALAAMISHRVLVKKDI